MSNTKTFALGFLRGIRILIQSDNLPQAIEMIDEMIKAIEKGSHLDKDKSPKARER